jgi:hypothetical protein
MAGGVFATTVSVTGGGAGQFSSANGLVRERIEAV